MFRPGSGMGILAACLMVGVLHAPPPAAAQNPNVGGSGNGYWILDGEGGVFDRGDARFHGSIPRLRERGHEIGDTDPVSLTSTATGSGYWILDGAGGIFSFGDAEFHGSVPQLRRAGHEIGEANPVDLEVTTAGSGYWILDGAGGIFSFGDAEFHGSLPQLRRAGHEIGEANPVDLAATPSGDGYWILDGSGGIFSFGDADFQGSVPQLRRAGHDIGEANIIGMAPTGTGDGYWVFDDAGGIFAFGDSKFHGSLPDRRGSGTDVGSAPTVSVADSPTGGGYWVLNRDGRVFAFGDASDCGEPSPSAPALAIAVPHDDSLVEDRIVAGCDAGDTSTFSASSPWRVTFTGTDCLISVYDEDGDLRDNAFGDDQLVQIRESGQFFIEGDTDCAFSAFEGDGGRTSRPFTIGAGGGQSLPFETESSFSIEVSGTDCLTSVYRNSDGKLLDNEFGSDYTMQVTHTGTLFVGGDVDCRTTVEG